MKFIKSKMDILKFEINTWHEFRLEIYKIIIIKKNLKFLKKKIMIRHTAWWDFVHVCEVKSPLPRTVCLYPVLGSNWYFSFRTHTNQTFETNANMNHIFVTDPVYSLLKPLSHYKNIHSSHFHAWFWHTLWIAGNRR